MAPICNATALVKARYERVRCQFSQSQVKFTVLLSTHRLSRFSSKAPGHFFAKQHLLTCTTDRINDGVTVRREMHPLTARRVGLIFFSLPRNGDGKRNENHLGVLKSTRLICRARASLRPLLLTLPACRAAVRRAFFDMWQ
jgi:hypothetical protein